MGKKSGSGSGMNNPNHIPESLETIFWGLKYLNSLMRIRNPGWKKLGSGMEKFGSGINIPDPQRNTELQNYKLALGICTIDHLSQ
jgi:hypothetical protein